MVEYKIRNSYCMEIGDLFFSDKKNFKMTKMYFTATMLVIEFRYLKRKQDYILTLRRAK